MTPDVEKAAATQQTGPDSTLALDLAREWASRWQRCWPNPAGRAITYSQAIPAMQEEEAALMTVLFSGG
jgi:hypothetical protein